jgi:hypothetical protein
MSPGDAVQSYLDALAGSLSGSPEHVGRVRAEAHAHLRDAVDAHRAEGLDEAEATAAALREFGTVAQVTAAANRAEWARARGPVLVATAGLLVRLAATGMVLAGVTAVLARLLAVVTSVQVVFGLPAGAPVPQGRCADWLALHPGAAGCAQAATLEAADDLPLVAGATGALGVLLWGVVLLVRRRGPVHRPVLPISVEPASGAALFAAVAAGAAVLGGTDAVISTTWGAGLWWTGAGCALVLALGFAVRLWAALSRSHRSAGRLEIA